MAEMISFQAQARDGAGKGPARQLRRAGRVPAVIYGERKDQQMISLEARALRRELTNPRFFSTLCSLQLGGEAIRVLPREVQLHPVSDEPMHADFVRVSRGSTIHVTVRVVFLHEDISPGLKRGGVLNVVRREVELVCPADAIPEQIEIDLAGAEIGDSLHISQVTLPPNVHPMIADRDFTIATIAAPTVVAEEAAEEQGEAEAERPAEESPTEAG
ncbi:MAG TPA: 50S ribosomal protein L25/general stress protein Ctc [Geminicoccaceae bacterium]|nr:50S ribosomal protein L25/general stress protein Ctc [Geminicoccaceae bacterium]